MAGIDQPSRLLHLQPIDEDDPIDKELSSLFKELERTLEGMSDIEIHQALQAKASQNTKSHADIASGLLYGILIEPANAPTHFQRMSLINRDGYSTVISRLRYFAGLGKFRKIAPEARDQMIWIISELTILDVQGLDSIYCILLRQIQGGDLKSSNISHCESMLQLLERCRVWVDRHPRVITTAVYTFLRIIPDHMHRGYDALRQREVMFCVSLLREKWLVCCQIGRDLVRALQDVGRAIPEFEKLWLDIYQRPKELDPRFEGVLTLLRSPTNREYFQCRITPDMEAKLMHIMNKLSGQKYQQNLKWFANRYLATSESENIIPDLVRFIVGFFHPTNQQLASDLVARYTIIHQLMKGIQSHVVMANVKLALFYDWLFYDPQVDNIMNIEPAVLLLERNLERHPYLCIILIQFLAFVTDEYYPEMKNETKSHVQMAMKDLLDKGVIRSLAPFIYSKILDVATKSQMRTLFDTLVDINIPEGQFIEVETPPGYLQTTSSYMAAWDRAWRQSQSVTSALHTAKMQSFKRAESLVDEHGILTEEDAEEQIVGAQVWSTVTPGIEDDEEVRDTSFDDLYGDDDSAQPQRDEDLEDEDTQYLRALEEVSQQESVPQIEYEHMETDGMEIGEIVETEEELENEVTEAMEPDQQEIEDAEYDEEEREFSGTQSAWIFGDLLTEFRSAASMVIEDEDALENARKLLADIINIYFRMAVPPENFAPIIARPIRRLACNTQLDVKYLDPSGPPVTDLLEVLIDLFWSNAEVEANTNKMLTLLGLLSSRAKPTESGIIGSRVLIGLLRRGPRDHDGSVSQQFLAHAIRHWYLSIISFEDTPNLKEYFLRDMQKLQENETVAFHQIVPIMLKHLPDLCVGDAEFVKLIVSVIESHQLNALVTQLALEELELFGECDYDDVLSATVYWDSFEQITFWQLLNAELGGRPEKIERLFLTAGTVTGLEADENPEPFPPLLTLLRSIPPTKSLLEAIMPMIFNVHGDVSASNARFVAATLEQWRRTYPTEMTALMLEMVEQAIETVRTSAEMVEQPLEEPLSGPRRLVDGLKAWWQVVIDNKNEIDHGLVDIMCYPTMNDSLRRLISALNYPHNQLPLQWYDDRLLTEVYKRHSKHTETSIRARSLNKVDRDMNNNQRKSPIHASKNRVRSSDAVSQLDEEDEGMESSASSRKGERKSRSMEAGETDEDNDKKKKEKGQRFDEVMNMSEEESEENDAGNKGAKGRRRTIVVSDDE